MTAPDAGAAPLRRRIAVTVGHGAQEFEDIARLLEPHDVGVIVDVRSEPYSRHAPDFTKASLATLAAEAGLGYRWLGDRLGGRHPEGAIDPTDFAAGIDEVLGLTGVTTVALLCSEAEPAACHRTRVIAPALVEAGVEVRHLLHDGGIRLHQDTLF